MYGDELPWDWSSVVGGLDGVCLEVSSAGLHKRHGKLYPNVELLAEANARGVPITLASDAHVPQNVGRDLDRAIEHARTAGYETVTVFEKRQARQEPLG
jgi:histidinol-phosphatase (PHP family)